MKSKFFLISVCLIVGIAATFWLRSPANPASAPRSLSQDPPAEPLRVETDWDALIAEAGSASFPSIMEDALKLSDATERNRVITKLAVRWLNKDRADFLAFLEKVEVDDALDNSNKFWRLIPALGEAFTLVDEEAAFSPVLNDVVQKYVEMYVSLNPTEALAWVEKWLLDDARDQSIAMIIEATAADDPLAAHALLATIKQPYRRLEGIQGVAAGLHTTRQELSDISAHQSSVEKLVSRQRNPLYGRRSGQFGRVRAGRYSSFFAVRSTSSSTSSRNPIHN